MVGIANELTHGFLALSISNRNAPTTINNRTTLTYLLSQTLEIKLSSKRLALFVIVLSFVNYSPLAFRKSFLALKL